MKGSVEGFASFLLFLSFSSLSAQFWYQPVLKYTHFTSLIFCLLICSASELSVTCPIRGSPSASSRGSILVLMPSIDASLLPFFFSVASNLSPLFYPIRLLFHLFSLPSYQSLALCLSLTFLPSFSLHIHCYHTSSVPSLHLSHHSFSLFFSCPSPFHLIHSPTLSPLLPPSLPLTVVTGRSLWLSHRPPVSILTAPFTCCSLFSFFCWFVL